MILIFWGAVFIYAPIGLRYPLQAIKGAFYANIVSYICSWGLVIAAASAQPIHNLTHLFSTMFARSMLQMPLWMAGHLTVAYLVSATKRGWYRPTLADFKLTMPRRRPQISR